MTTIAVDMDSKSMSCDNLTTDASGYKAGHLNKIIKFEYDFKNKNPVMFSDGLPKYHLKQQGCVLVGVAGCWDSGTRFVQWLYENLNLNKNKDFSQLENHTEFSDEFECLVVFQILTPDKLDFEYRLFYVSGSCSFSEITVPKYAIGSGQQFALSMLENGFSTKEAVKFAARFDTSTGGDIFTYTFDETERLK